VRRPPVERPTRDDGVTRRGLGDGALAGDWILGMTTDQHILIVEHDELTTATYARMLRIEGYQVQTAFSAEDGLRELESSHPDVIIVDFHMPSGWS
jgi:PleD family two-component response regulator